MHYEWDQFGQIAGVRRSIGPRIEYRYDSLLRLKGYRAGSEFDVEYAYDFLGRIEAIKTPVGEIRYEYWTGHGKTIRILPNGIRTIWEHEPDGQLAAITHVDPNGYQIAKFSYGYRPDALVERILEWSPRGERQLSFEYDSVQRLAVVSDSVGRSWRSNYDGLGNRTKEVFGDGYAVDYRHDWAGRLTSINGAPCAHDDCANLSIARLDGGLRRYEFDHDNRICRVHQGEVSYEYDGDGYLIARTCHGERTVYTPDPLCDEWHPLVESLPSGRQRFYLWDDLTPLAVVENGAGTFFLHDHMGSVRCITDRSGKVIERRDYSAFGVFEGLRTDAGLVPGFAGLFWDSEAAVYLTRARAYSPDLGRFLQMDPQHRVPFGSQRDLSPYAYCGNDPINSADSTGLMPERIGEGEDGRGVPTGRRGVARGPGGGDNGGVDSAGGSGHDRRGSFRHWQVPDLRSPPMREKRAYPKLAAYVVATVTNNVDRYAVARFGTTTGLTEDQIREARRFGLRQFFFDHSCLGPNFETVYNNLTMSAFGEVDLDWFTHLGFVAFLLQFLLLSLAAPSGALYWSRIPSFPLT